MGARRVFSGVLGVFWARFARLDPQCCGAAAWTAGQRSGRFGAVSRAVGRVGSTPGLPAGTRPRPVGLTGKSGGYPRPIPHEVRHVLAMARAGVTAGLASTLSAGGDGPTRANMTQVGILTDVASGEVIIGSLSIPHSPRWSEGPSERER
jgi:hypothetical protein